VASDTTINGRFMEVFGGGVAFGTRINSGADEYVYGTATDTTINDGTMVVEGGTSHDDQQRWLRTGSASV
jgi:autotransporter passenger strand-loop-strand repeat protein